MSFNNLDRSSERARRDDHIDSPSVRSLSGQGVSRNEIRAGACRHLAAMALAAGLSAAAAQAAAPAALSQLDLNRNGVSDVWETLFNATGFDLDFDSDGDGVPNRYEAAAGTDPRSAGSVPRISGFRLTPAGFAVTMQGALGKRLELESCDVSRGGPATNWVKEGNVIARTNAVVTLVAPADQPSRIFRMSVADVDTDGDGLNDWEEYKLGLNPLGARSNARSDGHGQPFTDYAYVTNLLQSQSLASLLAPRASAAVGASGPVCTTVAASDGFSVASAPSGSGLTGLYYTNASSTYTNPINFNATNLFWTTNDAIIDFSWGPATTPDLSNGFYTVRWTGQVEPQYSETYIFETRTDDGVKLWVNDQLLIDRWQNQSATTWTNAITLVAGVRYNLRMDYFTRGGSARARLSWYSASQGRQVIPSLRLYPSSDGYAPGAVTSPAYAIGFVGQPFSYTITGANSPLGYDATNLPPGLTVDTTNGLVSGVPSVAGRFAVGLISSNAVGLGYATLDLEILDTGSAVTREVWLNVPGVSITNIPLQRPPTLTNLLGNLEGLTNFGDNYAERIRGYVVAPVSGNYYFWLSGNSAAELWISNDEEPVNKVRRANVTKATLPRQWNLTPGQRSGWLSLRAGQRYYLEVLHKAGTGADHWAVGWLLDPTGTNTVPSGIVPGYVLAPFVETPITNAPGTLYSANMVAQSGALSSGVGSATLRLSPDESQAVLRFSYGGLSAPVTGMHIHADTYKGKNGQGQIVFDIDDAIPEVDGSYIWVIEPSGPLTADDLRELLKEGKAYINIHSAAYPGGEINGHFGLAAGSPTFTPPPAPLAWTDDHTSTNAAVRFLAQATFGASPAEIKAVRAMGYSKWLEQQFALKPSGHLTNILRNPSSDPGNPYPGTFTFNTWWQQSVAAPDQLRQRVAFALSQILVVSEEGPLEDNSRALSAYYDLLLKHAFGNFRDLLKDVTLSPAMGIYLDMRRNDKGNLALGTHPNENYAREILQLFSVGLNRMWPDGSLVLNSRGDLVPTYDQDVITGFSYVFTGWNYAQNSVSNRLPSNWNPSPNYTNAMVLVPTHHELNTKRLLDNVILPAAQGAQANPSTTNYDAYGVRELDLALDSIFQNQNVGPFICRQLIQRLVTSHPSRDYLYRVVQKFNDNGTGVRGDMKAVIKAILLDYEARSTNLIDQPTFGKQREPLLRATALARALPAPLPVKATYKQNGSQLITITTPKPHRLGPSDDVFLSFVGNPAPPSRIYNNVAVSNANTFTVTASGAAAGTYGQVGGVITITNSSHRLNVGSQLYLTFVSGGAASRVYTVASVLSGSVFTVATSDSAARSGACVFPRWTGGGFTHSGTNITFYTTGPHGLTVGKTVYVEFPGGVEATDGVYRIASVPAPDRFVVGSAVTGNRTESDPVVLPLAAAPLTRSGSVTIRYNTWNMNATDGGFSSSLSQTPLNSPTVFNFFFPDFKYPGILAAAGLTTPEFQLTSDTTAILQMNFITSGLFNNGNNTNGLSSFSGGNGSITLDVGAWMTPTLTSDAGIPALVGNVNTMLCAGQLSASAKSIIVNYVASTARFPYTSAAPTGAQMRDRVRAVVHLVASSPEFIVQR